jgi:hypothetical protein
MRNAPRLGRQVAGNATLGAASAASCDGGHIAGD